ncbi:DUF5960 family protein [Enterococcus avium]|uniref:DUF5960 family protein n=1 Tax=Enterococcus TaxID=1350 RepID=UPI001F0CCA9C|nr:DUF5960 family protein [Enterococcus avium]MDT2472178.1 DUF5960 family protein [Enterococcus avium]
MNKRNLTSFKIHGYKAVDSQDHIFYFDVRNISENSRIRVYSYTGMDLEKHGLLKKE